MMTAYRAREAGNVDRCLEYLNRYVTYEHRGFEWRYLWDLCHRNAARAQLPSGGLGQIRFSPDGQTLAITARDKLSLWDFATRKQLDQSAGYGEASPGLAFSPDGSTMATSSLDGAVRIWKRNSLNELILDDELVPATGSQRAMWVEFSSSGRFLAAAVGNTVKLWNTQDFSLLSDPIEIAHDEVLALAFSPNQESLLAFAQGNRVCLWSIDTNVEVGLPMSHANSVWQVAFTPDGKKLVSAGQRRLGNTLGRPISATRTTVSRS